MRKLTTPCLTAVLAPLASLLIIAGCASTPDANRSTNVVAVDNVDAQRYAGKWYEVARLPNRFQSDCAANVTATYALDEQGLAVTNRCEGKDGQTDEAIGRARRTGDSGAKLKVSFLPSLLSRFAWLPFGWGDYWVLDLANDYSHAMVGSPDNKFLWMLSRTPAINESTYQSLLKKAQSMGYDSTSVVRTIQRGG